MISSIVSRLVILVFGYLYPAYASYKAVRTKNVKEYVKWMMYWIVFALFTCAETFTDVFFSFWFPFYYEIKTILVFWLLSPATQGSSILYRRFVHPALIRREAEIDDALARATEQGYTAVLHLGTKGVNYATTVLMQTAIKQLGVPALTEEEVAITKPTVSSSARPRASSTPATSPPSQLDSKDQRDGIEIVATEEEVARPSSSTSTRRRKTKEPKPIKTEVLSDTEELVPVYVQQTKKREPRVTRQRLARAAKEKKDIARKRRVLESDEEMDADEAHEADESSPFWTYMNSQEEWRQISDDAEDLQDY